MPLPHQPPRKYQREGISAIRRAWESNKKPMISVATGGGKTVMIAQLLVESLPSTERSLIIAHTEEIVQQIHDTVGLHYGPSVGIVMGNYNDVDSQVIVASRQSLGSKRLSAILSYGSINLIIIDEAHHATSDNTYGEIVEILTKDNAEAKLVGFTATPTRSDQKGTDEEGDLFDDIVFSWTISDGINTGFLVPAWEIEVKGNVLKSKNWVDYTFQIYKSYIHSSKRPCLAFFPSVKMSKQFSRSLRRRGYSAAHVDGNTPKEEREFILSSYKKGDIKIVCNMEVLTEGFDAPNTSAILLARPTHSRTLFTQILGRGLRTSHNKRNCLLVNFTCGDEETFRLHHIINNKKLMGIYFLHFRPISP